MVHLQLPRIDAVHESMECVLPVTRQFISQPQRYLSLLVAEKVFLPVNPLGTKALAAHAHTEIVRRLETFLQPCACPTSNGIKAANCPFGEVSETKEKIKALCCRAAGLLRGQSDEEDESTEEKGIPVTDTEKCMCVRRCVVCGAVAAAAP